MNGGYPYAFFTAADSTGHWELRALPDSTYRVMWDPYLPEDQWPLAIPPVETINLNPLDTVHDNTVHVIARIVEIRGANRILDINFGIPPQPPVVGTGGAPRLPSTGSGGGGAANEAVLYVAIGASLVLAAVGMVLRRRRQT